jgi:hypothetical protein
MLGNPAMVGDEKAGGVSGVQVGGTGDALDCSASTATGEAVTVGAGATCVGRSDDSGSKAIPWQPAKIIRTKVNTIKRRFMILWLLYDPAGSGLLRRA